MDFWISEFSEAFLGMYSGEEINQGAVKKEYANKAIDYYLKYLYQAKRLQKEFGACWSECQECQGSILQEVICSNNDCPIFYRRIKLRKDLTEVSTKLKRFQ